MKSIGARPLSTVHIVGNKLRLQRSVMLARWTVLLLPILASAFERPSVHSSVSRVAVVTRGPSFAHIRMQADEAADAAPAEPEAPAEEPEPPAMEAGGGNLIKNVGIFAVLAAALIFQRGGLDVPLDAVPTP